MENPSIYKCLYSLVPRPSRKIEKVGLVSVVGRKCTLENVNRKTILVGLHTMHSVHLHPSRFTRLSFSLFWGSGSKTVWVLSHYSWYLNKWVVADCVLVVQKGFLYNMGLLYVPSLIYIWIHLMSCISPPILHKMVPIYIVSYIVFWIQLLYNDCGWVLLWYISWSLSIILGVHIQCMPHTHLNNPWTDTCSLLLVAMGHVFR